MTETTGVELTDFQGPSLTKLSDEELLAAQRTLVNRQVSLWKSHWAWDGVMILCGILGAVGVIEIFIGGLMHGYGWFVFFGALGAYMHHRQKSAQESNLAYMAKIGRELARRKGSSEAGAP